MENDEKNRAHVLKLLTTNLPAAFWQGMQDRARLLYPDLFSEVRANPRLNDSQRPNVLWQDRHYAMEWLLADEARRNGVPAESNMIPRNKCHFTMVGNGPVRLLQNYVREPGAMPRLAGFRRQLASINAFERDSVLDLIEAERPFRAPSEIIGIIIGNPAGPNFREDHQALGAIGLYVPYSDFKGWAVSLTFAEIVASYEAPAEQADNVTPKLKPNRKTGSEE